MVRKSLQVQKPAVLYEHTDTSVGLNPAQLHFLQMLSHIKTDSALKDLKRMVRDHYSQQLQQEADRYWAEGKIGDHVLNEHLRTTYE